MTNPSSEHTFELSTTSGCAEIICVYPALKTVFKAKALLGSLC